MANCRYCGTDCPEQGEHDRFFDCALYTDRKPTNADRIRAMSDEEMAEWLTEFSSEAFAAGVFKMAGPIMTKQERLDWLQQPAIQAEAVPKEAVNEA